MVLKRKRGNQWVAVNQSVPETTSPTPNSNQFSTPVAAEPPAKRVRNARTPRVVEKAGPVPGPSTSGSRGSEQRPARASKKVPQQPSTSSQAGVAGKDTSAASSSSSHPPPTSKKPRKKKGQADPAESAPEKRAAKFKQQCPQNILDRLERVRSQTFFMVDRRRDGSELKEEFSVLGSTGNVYTVAIDRLPRCDCPDAYKGNHCKHIIFVMVKVLQVSRDSGLWYQKALLTSELEEIFSQAPAAPNAVTNHRVQEAYARATGKATSSTTESSKKRIPGEEDDCPICYDTMYQVAEEILVFCEECGNALHKACFQQWKSSSVKSGKELSCVWCRSRWVVAATDAGDGGVRKGGYYLNLAGAAGLSPVRDTSTYYHGPRRGQRYYGSQHYSDD